MVKLGPVKSYDKRIFKEASFDHSPITKNEDSTARYKLLDFEASASIIVSKSSLVAKPASSDKSENLPTLPINKRGRKRKQGVDPDYLETSYLQRLAREEVKASDSQSGTPHNIRKSATKASETPPLILPLTTDAPFLQHDYSEAGSCASDGSKKTLRHESVAASTKEVEVEKASRTVFLGNVSTMAIKSKSAKRTLLDHLISPVSQDGEHGVKHAIESIRFRSTPFNDARLPKKAAFAKKELMDSTTKSTNAYAVYVSQAAARAAVKSLNGSIVLDRHLRVDSVAHPAPQDYRRSIFVGNLGFVDDDSNVKEVEDDSREKYQAKESKEPADYEEGLWRTFMQAGEVESVRLVRDKTTRIGKGFAYVQFYDANTVERALIFNDKKYPPMLPRRLRVVKAKVFKKRPASGEKRGQYLRYQKRNSATSKPKASLAVRTISGRAPKLLGRAGSAQLKEKHNSDRIDVAKTPDLFVLEGYRASRNMSKPMSMAKKRAKPQSRSSRRGTEFKRLKASD